ncbi:MAG: 2-C-methyl-D-erythritol 4-phosphate cytidylyltransferase [Cytophagaceae bacterium]|jgi:2-C-methyl-D-erythritol 4-phosphate cytidylyltransferase|nr:2-C-methyl-D-erythritol 4-phosphate cytidylyltransferase [Cytophagaceae bacterium]
MRYAVIVAGGSGTRFGSEIPKQFLLLQGKPVLAHTLEQFYKADASIDIRLVLPSAQIQPWKELCSQHHISIPHTIIEGGASRFQSVRKGLLSISDASKESVVAIHDGVRPLIAASIILNSFDAALKYGNAITSVASKDSVRLCELSGNKALDRALVRIIQTPQTFLLSQILTSFKTEELPFFTDDASVAEHAGFPIHLIEGSYSNLKITTPEDLKLAEILLT